MLNGAKKQDSTYTRHHVRPCDIDSLSHLNHAKAIEMLELGRFHWSSERGIGIERFSPVVTRVDVSYQREIFLGEIAVITRLAGARHYTAEFHQQIIVPGQEPAYAVSARVYINFLDRASRRPVRLERLDFLANTSVASAVLS